MVVYTQTGRTFEGGWTISKAGARRKDAPEKYDYLFNDNEGTLHKVVSEVKYSDSNGLDLDKLPTAPLDVNKYHLTWLPCWTVWDGNKDDPSVFIKRPPYSNEDAVIPYGELATMRECELLTVNPHPNICPYLGCVVKDGRITGIAQPNMEYDLCLHLRKNRIEDVEGFIRDIRSALNHIRSLGVLYIDLKPDNIMWNGERWCLIDCSECFAAGTTFRHCFGTPGWMDPDARVVSDALIDTLVDNLEKYVRTSLPDWEPYED